MQRFVALALLLLLAPPVRAQEVVTTTMSGAELGSIVLPAHSLVITAPVVINLADQRVAQPINIPVDIYYGFDGTVTLGLSHSGGTVQGVSPYPRGAGLCITGGGGCRMAYDNTSFDGLYRITGGTLQLAGHGGLDIASLSDSLVRVRLGALGKAPLGDNVAIVTDPRVALAIVKRASDPDRLDFPLAVQYTTDSGIRSSLQGGVGGPLTSFDEDFVGWLSVFGALGVNEKIEAFASFTLDNLYGRHATLDQRTVVVGFNIRP